MSSFQPFQPVGGPADAAPSQQHTTVFIPQATKAPANNSNPTTIVTATDDVDTYASWSLQWVNNSKEHIWNVGNPQFKFCKKRKEFYSDDMPSVWYKAPYKYHMSLEVGNMDENEPVTALLDLQFEDGQKVVYSNKSNAKRSKKTPPSSTHELSSGVVSNNENTFTHSGKKSEVTIGPFTFNCCSYKFDGRKFRLVLYLINQHGVCCYLYSSPILIRAKKPIVNKGSKSKTSGSGKKRKHSDSEEDTDSNDDDTMGKPAPEKKQKLVHMQQQLAPLHTIPSTMAGMPLIDAITQQPVMAMPAQQQQPPSILLPQQQASLVSLMNGAGTTTNNMMMMQPQPIMDAMSYDASLGMFGPPSPTKWYQSSAFLGEHGLLFADKPLSGLEKVQTMIETFESMDDKDRKELMDKMFERASYPEREFIKRKYFTDTWESHPSSSTTTTTTTTLSTSTNTSTHQQQQQQQQASTSSDVDNIFNNVMNWQ